MDAKQLLEKARGRVVEGWCRNAVAIDRHGKDVYARSPDACAWCASGAVGRLAPLDRGLKPIDLAVEVAAGADELDDLPRLTGD